MTDVDKCASTNNDPHIIAQYYLDTVQTFNGISYEISCNNLTAY